MKCGVISKASDFPRWLWHAIDRSTGQVLALVYWKSDIIQMDGEQNERHLSAELHEVGKRKT